MDIECPYKPQYGISTHYVDGSYHTSTDNHGMWNHLWKQWWIMMEQLLDKYDICCLFIYIYCLSGKLGNYRDTQLCHLDLVINHKYSLSLGYIAEMSPMKPQGSRGRVNLSFVSILQETMGKITQICIKGFLHNLGTCG